MNTQVFPRDKFRYDVEELSVSHVELMTRDIILKSTYENRKPTKSGTTWIKLIANEKRALTRDTSRRHKRALHLLWKVKRNRSNEVAEAAPVAVAPMSASRQGNLRLQSRSFHPSTKLISIWRANVHDLATDAGITNVDIRLAGAADFELARELVRGLVEVTGAIAQYLREDSVSQLAITNGPRFANSFQLALCEEFKIVPDRAFEFLKLLNDELREAFDGGWEIAGSWGRVEMDRSGNLVFALNPVEIVEDPNFVEAVDEEM